MNDFEYTNLISKDLISYSGEFSSEIVHKLSNETEEKLHQYKAEKKIVKRVDLRQMRYNNLRSA